MKGNMEERAERLAQYIIENRTTVRAIYLRLLGDLGLDSTVLISDNRTQGHL